MTLERPLVVSVPRRIHRPALSQIILTIVVTGVAVTLCPVMIVVLSGGQGTHLILAFLGTFALLVLYFLYITSRIQIITSPEGIEYHQDGYSLYTTWENVERIGTVRFGQLDREGLFLHQAVMHTTPFFRLVHGNAVRDVRSRFIPFTPLLPNWRETPLGLDIRQYAPHVFDAELSGDGGVGG
jgi:hypothetical protein